LILIFDCIKVRKCFFNKENLYVLVRSQSESFYFGVSVVKSYWVIQPGGKNYLKVVLFVLRK